MMCAVGVGAEYSKSKIFPSLTTCKLNFYHQGDNNNQETVR